MKSMMPHGITGLERVNSKEVKYKATPEKKVNN
jgi:hypothetical protein